MKVCIFAESCDVAAAQDVLLALPADAYGQVYVADAEALNPLEPRTGEALDTGDLPAVPFSGPERVQINRVTSRPGRCALAEALAAWSAEWLPERAASAGESPTVWVLPGATATLAAADHDGVRRLITVLPSSQLLHG